MTRAQTFARLEEPCDVLVIGGGATGLGAALDAVSRGYRTTLVESSDFAKATSSRSTKLVHGGVRYLQQGNVGLVREALHERANMRRNAPHIVDRLAFICPNYKLWEGPYYFAGLKAYDMLALGSGFPMSRYLGKRDVLARSPDLRGDGLYGGTLYYDGQFDDARFALALARTAADLGATILNYARVTAFRYERERVAGARVRDEESGNEYDVAAKTVINATGIFVDEVRKLDEPSPAPVLTHSRGSHVVFPADVMRGETALLVPRTADGRVLFALPWHDHVVVGTTDIPVAGAELDPAPTRDEIDFIIAQASAYLRTPLRRERALAAFAGLRPLVKARAGEATSKISREHLVTISKSGVLTVTGGKWTTYRKMAEDVVDAAALHANLARSPSRTANLALRGSPGADAHPSDDAYASYGTDAGALRVLERDDPSLAQALHERLPYTRAEVVYAARAEFARTVDDVLARRTRALFIDIEAARESAAVVAEILANELGYDAAWAARERAAFERIAVRDATPLGRELTAAAVAD